MKNNQKSSQRKRNPRKGNTARSCTIRIVRQYHNCREKNHKTADAKSYWIRYRETRYFEKMEENLDQRIYERKKKRHLWVKVKVSLLSAVTAKKTMRTMRQRCDRRTIATKFPHKNMHLIFCIFFLLAIENKIILSCSIFIKEKVCERIRLAIRLTRETRCFGKKIEKILIIRPFFF